jgi:predicted NACHT family NTPase
MTCNYIPRTLVVNRGGGEERIITDDGIASIHAPIVLLGDPGSGKTELTKALAQRTGSVRIAAGAFYRNQNISHLNSLSGNRLIIDGLDEIASSSNVAAIDEVLKKLSQLGNPNFLLSCRSADWQGSTDRYKIREDYGLEPVTLHLHTNQRGRGINPFERRIRSHFPPRSGVRLGRMVGISRLQFDSSGRTHSRCD